MMSYKPIDYQHHATGSRNQCQSSEHAQDEAANVQIDNSWQKFPGGLGICK